MACHRIATCLGMTVALALYPAAFGAAQEAEPQAPSGGWRRLGDPPETTTAAPRPAGPEAVPAQLTLPAGAWIRVRVNEALSSNQNRVGDGFTATLQEPLVVQGFVVARRGQTVGGRVAEVNKGGRVKGTSRLGLELTEISLVDGQQLPVRTELVEYAGGRSGGRDATAIATTSGVGAAIGAAAEGGFGAGMGAIAGAAASTIAVLATRGRPTVVMPEDSLTFRTLAPVTISTERSQHAFQAVRQEDYEPKQLQRRTAVRPTLYPPGYYYGGYYGWGWPYGPFFYGPGFWGPSVFIYSRPVYHAHGFGRGFHRR